MIIFIFYSIYSLSLNFIKSIMASLQDMFRELPFYVPQNCLRKMKGKTNMMYSNNSINVNVNHGTIHFNMPCLHFCLIFFFIFGALMSILVMHVSPDNLPIVLFQPDNMFIKISRKINKWN